MSNDIQQPEASNGTPTDSVKSKTSGKNRKVRFSPVLVIAAAMTVCDRAIGSTTEEIQRAKKVVERFIGIITALRLELDTLDMRVATAAHAVEGYVPRLIPLTRQMAKMARATPLGIELLRDTDSKSPIEMGRILLSLEAKVPIPEVMLGELSSVMAEVETSVEALGQAREVREATRRKYGQARADLLMAVSLLKGQLVLEKVAGRATALRHKLKAKSK